MPQLSLYIDEETLSEINIAAKIEKWGKETIRLLATKVSFFPQSIF